MASTITRLLLIPGLVWALTGNLHAQQETSIPGPFHGTWTWHKSGTHPRDGEAPLIITATKITAHETTGEVTRVSQSAKDRRTCTVIVSAACEGMEGNEQITLTLSPDGQRLTLAQVTANTCAFGAGVYRRSK